MQFTQRTVEPTTSNCTDSTITMIVKPNTDASASPILRDEFTQRGLKPRHTFFIALTSTVGTGFFIGAGQTLARGGPALLVSSVVSLAFLVYCVFAAIAQAATYDPSQGCSVNALADRYVSKSLGVSLGWLLVNSLAIIVPYEITACALIIQEWTTISMAIPITIMIIFIVGTNLCPVGVYGEVESFFSMIKLALMAGLLILCLVLTAGGGPTYDEIGVRYWKDPGPANAYLQPGVFGIFLALLSTLIRCALLFAFFPELVVASTGEMKNPRKDLPAATKHFIWRSFIFFIGGAIAMSFVCASNDPRLTTGGTGAGESPFVLAIKNARIPALPHIVNGCIVSAALSTGNAALYFSSRSLYSLALTGSAPKIFKKCSKKGVPYMAVLACSLVSLLAYMNCGASSAVVFNWLVNVTNSSAFISWACCNIISLRFRKACQAQQISDLPFRSKLQPYCGWAGLVVFSFLCLMNQFEVFFPGHWDTANFVTGYIGLVAFLTCYLGHRFTYGRNDRWVRLPSEVDLTTGVDDLEAQKEGAIQRETIQVAEC